MTDLPNPKAKTERLIVREIDGEMIVGVVDAGRTVNLRIDRAA